MKYLITLATALLIVGCGTVSPQDSAYAAHVAQNYYACKELYKDAHGMFLHNGHNPEHHSISQMRSDLAWNNCKFYLRDAWVEL